MRLRPILRGLKTYFVREADRPGTGGTNSARYCYAVWLRHRILARNAGAPMRARVVAELGPGDSLGIGLCALLSGAERYVGLDVVRHARQAVNAQVFEDLLGLFARKADVPPQDEFPAIRPPLASHAFPADILGDLAVALAPERVAEIRAALKAAEVPGTASRIAYRVPWHDPSVIEEASVDLLYSQAVLEHVEDLDVAYDAMRRWVAPGGVMTHQIDFKSHGMTPEWNGHLEYPEGVWSLVRGRRSFLLNRKPWSVHRAQFERHGFRILDVIRNERHDGLPASRLAAPFRGLSDEDATTAGAFVVAVRT